ncbi:MAG: serine/threonine protein kinase [Myxococcaceae bacterium]|nr:serine/threonine protein kinase [Myxococcaceae bacterium]
MNSSPSVIPLNRPVTAPRRFGKYILIRKLAEGGMAEIFLAKQIGAEGFERDVVIKCMLDHFSQSREFVSMFLDEARLAARLHHPNIVQITDLGVADSRYFICMEYLAGEDLDAVIAAAHYKGERIPVPLAARIILSALEGLEFAHNYQEQGRPLELVHRDISPSNIFVTYQGTVKVLDFGIAKASSRMTQTQPGLLKGKWGYMSPEQARGEPIDARSDLFSLGITFHELLTARRVFEREHEIGVLLALMAQPIPAPSSVRPEIPPALDRIIAKALERRREDRYASAAEMRTDLEEFLRGTASAPGTSQLAQYMQGLFGPSDVERKTKIPSLAELGGIEGLDQFPLADPVGYEKTLVRPSDPIGIPAIAAPAPAQPPPARSTGLSMAIGALAAVALLGLGGGAVWYFMPRAGPTASVVVQPPLPPAAEPPPAPVAAAPAEPVAPAPAPPPAEPAEVASTPTPKPPRPSAAPTQLTSKDVNKVLRKHRGKLLECGEKFRAELPPDRRVMLLLTVSHSGAVREAKVSEPSPVSPGLAKCLEGQMKRASFPRNNHQPELTIQLPLRFNEN